MSITSIIKIFVTNVILASRNFKAGQVNGYSLQQSITHNTPRNVKNEPEAPPAIYRVDNQGPVSQSISELIMKILQNISLIYHESNRLTRGPLSLTWFNFNPSMDK